MFCQQPRATGWFSTPWFVRLSRVWAVVAERVRLHGRAVRASSSSTPMPFLAISPTLPGTPPPRRWAVIDDRPRRARRAGDEAMRALAFEEAARLRVGTRDRRRCLSPTPNGGGARGPRCRAPLRPAQHRAHHLRRGHRHRASNRDHQMLAQAALTLEPAGDRAMDRDILDGAGRR